MNPFQSVLGQYDHYDQAIKRVVVLVALAEQGREPSAHFENVRQWMEGSPWHARDSAFAFAQLAKAQHLLAHGEAGAARHELISLIRFLAGKRAAEPSPWQGATVNAADRPAKRSAHGGAPAGSFSVSRLVRRIVDKACRPWHAA